MGLKVYDVATQTVDPTIKMVVAGEPGTGKTRTASTWPAVLYLDLDDGLLSVRDRKVRGIDVDSIDTLEEIKKGLDQPKSEHKRIFGSAVETVVIDTLDELAKLVMRERLAAEQHATAQMADWGYLGDTMRNLVRGFRNLDGVNVIFNVHLKSEEDSETGRIVYKPSIQGAFGNEIAAYVDIAVLMKARTQTDPKTNDKVTKRYFQSSPDSQFPWLKDRSGSLPGQFDINLEDDYERLHDLIFGALFRDTAAEARAVAAELKAEAKTAPADDDEKTTKTKPKATTKPKAAKSAPAPEATVPTEPEPDPAPADQPPAEAPAPEATEPESTPEPSAASVAIEEDQTADENGRITTPDVPDDQEIAEMSEVDRLKAQLAELEAQVQKAASTPVEEGPEPETQEPDVPEVGTEDPETTEPEAEPETEAVAEAVTKPTPEPAAAPAADLPACAECGIQVENKDYADLSKIRFKKPLCREHFAAAKSAKA